MYIILGQNLPFWMSEEDHHLSITSPGPVLVTEVTDSVKRGLDKGDILGFESKKDAAEKILETDYKKKPKGGRKELKTIISHGEFRPDPAKFLVGKQVVEKIDQHKLDPRHKHIFSAGIMTEEEIKAEVEARRLEDEQRMQQRADSRRLTKRLKRWLSTLWHLK